MKSDPYKVDGPARISFSGGRSSAYMLYRILQAHGGELPEGIEVMFANTGKEHPATLDFVRDCGERWGVHIHWVELEIVESRMTTKTVTYETASREGEPFMALIKYKQMLPNPRMRFCTQELKVNRLLEKMRELGHEDEDYDDVMGIRADEPHRVSRIREKDDRRTLMPLAAGGADRDEVVGFWAGRNFDLQLPVVQGATPFGSCDLCFLKGPRAIAALLRSEPERAKWWIEAERAVPQRLRNSTLKHATFRMGVSYEDLEDRAARWSNNLLLFDDADELIPLMDCTNCTD